MFTAEHRDRLRDELVAQARSDPRLVAAAAVGSSARGGDRWSDLDLTFGVASGIAIETVLADWTRAMEDERGAAVLFDLPVGPTIYRVFLLPGALQVDLSFSPASSFGPRGPRFDLIFGEAVDLPAPPPPDPARMFGFAVHHLVRAQICLARGRLWQAEFWLHEARDEALALACLRHGLESSHGRGFDRLPADARERFTDAFPHGLTASAVRASLGVIARELMRTPGEFPAAERTRTMLAELIARESSDRGGDGNMT